MEKNNSFLTKLFDFQGLLTTSASLFYISAFIFVISSYLYYNGKSEDENPNLDYQTAAKVAASLIVLDIFWQFFSGHIANTFIHTIIAYLAFCLHTMSEENWKKEEFRWNTVPCLATITYLELNSFSWNSRHKHFQTAKMQVVYEYSGEVYRSELEVPLSIYVTYQENDKIALNISKNYPEVLELNVSQLEEKTFIPEKVEKSQVFISES